MASNTETTSEWMTRKEVMELLGCSSFMVMRFRSEGRIRYAADYPGMQRYLREDVERIHRQREEWKERGFPPH